MEGWVSKGEGRIWNKNVCVCKMEAFSCHFLPFIAGTRAEREALVIFVSLSLTELLQFVTTIS